MFRDLKATLIKNTFKILHWLKTRGAIFISMLTLLFRILNWIRCTQSYGLESSNLQCYPIYVIPYESSINDVTQLGKILPFPVFIHLSHTRRLKNCVTTVHNEILRTKKD